jgi:hypothetical protein
VWEVTTTTRYAKLSPRPLAQYGLKEIRFCGKDAVVRKTAIGWQAFRNLSQLASEVEYFENWETAIRWALEEKR